MYSYTLNLKGFIPKHTSPLKKKDLPKYISIEKVLNKNNIFKYWKTCLVVCTDSNSSSSQILLRFGPQPSTTSVFYTVYVHNQ